MIDNLSSKEEITIPLPSLQQDVLATAKGSGILYFGSLFEYATRFVMGIIMARFMGVEQYGLYSLAYTAFPMFGSLVMFSLDTTLVRYIPMYESRQDRESLRGVLQIGLLIPFILGVLGGICLLALAGPIAELIFKEPQLVPVLWVAAIGFPFHTLLVAAVGAMRGFNRMRHIVIARDMAVSSIKLILVVVILATIGLNAINMMIIHIIGELVGSVLLLRFLHQLFPLNRSWQASRYHFREVLHFCLPLYGSDLIGSVRGNLQTLLLGSLNTVTSVGFFTVAQRVNLVTTIFQGGINIAAMSVISKLQSQGEYKQLGNFYQIVTKWLLAINLPLVLITIFFAKPILSIFGDDFISGSTILIILSCGSLVDAATGINGPMISMTGHTKLNTLNTIIALILGLVLSALLIPYWGAVGAAITAAISTSVVNLIRTLEIFWLFRLLPYERSFIKPLVAGAVAALGIFLVRQWLPVESNLIYAALGAGFLLVIYVGVTLALGLSEADRMVLSHFLARLKVKLPMRFYSI